VRIIPPTAQRSNRLLYVNDPAQLNCSASVRQRLISVWVVLGARYFVAATRDWQCGHRTSGSVAETRADRCFEMIWPICVFVRARILGLFSLNRDDSGQSERDEPLGSCFVTRTWRGISKLAVVDGVSASSRLPRGCETTPHEYLRLQQKDFPPPCLETYAHFALGNSKKVSKGRAI
jgi:hypothetical protein